MPGASLQVHSDNNNYALYSAIEVVTYGIGQI